MLPCSDTQYYTTNIAPFDRINSLCEPKTSYIQPQIMVLSQPSELEFFDITYQISFLKKKQFVDVNTHSNPMFWPLNDHQNLMGDC